jgi:hypothetical protein
MLRLVIAFALLGACLGEDNVFSTRPEVDAIVNSMDLAGTARPVLDELAVIVNSVELGNFDYCLGVSREFNDFVSSNDVSWRVKIDDSMDVASNATLEARGIGNGGSRGCGNVCGDCPNFPSCVNGLPKSSLYNNCVWSEGCVPGASSCILTDNLDVLTPDGYKNVQDLWVGDVVIVVKEGGVKVQSKIALYRPSCLQTRPLTFLSTAKDGEAPRFTTDHWATGYPLTTYRQYTIDLAHDAVRRPSDLYYFVRQLQSGVDVAVYEDGSFAGRTADKASIISTVFDPSATVIELLTEDVGGLVVRDTASSTIGFVLGHDDRDFERFPAEVRLYKDASKGLTTRITNRYRDCCSNAMSFNAYVGTVESQSRSIADAWTAQESPKYPSTDAYFALWQAESKSYTISKYKGLSSTIASRLPCQADDNRNPLWSRFSYLQENLSFCNNMPITDGINKAAELNKVLLDWFDGWSASDKCTC